MAKMYQVSCSYCNKPKQVSVSRYNERKKLSSGRLHFFCGTACQNSWKSEHKLNSPVADKIRWRILFKGKRVDYLHYLFGVPPKGHVYSFISPEDKEAYLKDYTKVEKKQLKIVSKVDIMKHAQDKYLEDHKVIRKQKYARDLEFVKTSKKRIEELNSEKDSIFNQTLGRLEIKEWVYLKSKNPELYSKSVKRIKEIDSEIRRIKLEHNQILNTIKLRTDYEQKHIRGLEAYKA